MTTPPFPSEPASLRESLAFLVAEHQPLIDRYARPSLRGTPFQPDDVYSKIQYDIAEGNSWLLRMWEDNDGSFDNIEAALVRAIQYIVRSLINKWQSDLKRFTADDYQDAGIRGAATTSPQEDWVKQYGQRQQILAAIALAGLTQAEACIIRTRLADLDNRQADSLLADILQRGDPAEMPDETRKLFEGYRRQIQRRAYAKLRFYFEHEDKEGGGSDE